MTIPEDQNQTTHAGAGENEDKNTDVDNGEINRVLRENAGKNLEFGEMNDPNSKNTVHSGRPKSNHTGIDRGRWAD